MASGDLADLTQASLLLHHLVEAEELEEQQQLLQRVLFEPSPNAGNEPRPPQLTQCAPAKPSAASPLKPASTRGSAKPSVIDNGTVNRAKGRPGAYAAERLKTGSKVASLSRPGPAAVIDKPLKLPPSQESKPVVALPAKVAAEQTPNSGVIVSRGASIGGEEIYSDSFGLASPSESTGSCTALPRSSSGTTAPGEAGPIPPQYVSLETPHHQVLDPMAKEMNELHVFTARSTNKNAVQPLVRLQGWSRAYQLITWISCGLVKYFSGIELSIWPYQHDMPIILFCS